MEIIARFRGQEAQRHVLRAFEGTQSLEGLARAITLNTHFAITGTVRKRYPFEGSPPVYLAVSRPGSFETIFHFLADPNNIAITSVIGTVTAGALGNFVYDLVKLTFRRAIGQDHDPETAPLRRYVERRPGDVEALVEAIEPSLKRAHSVVNNGAGTINIISGDHNVVTFDSTSKAYLEETILDTEILEKNVSVNMLNVTTRNGRVFDYELGRTVPIRVLGDADAATVPTLATSLRTYSRRLSRLSDLRGTVSIVFQTERAIDGTPKRYIVRSARIPDDE